MDEENDSALTIKKSNSGVSMMNGHSKKNGLAGRNRRDDLHFSQQITHLSKRAGKFLRLGNGGSGMNLLQVVHPGLRTELRAALFQSAKSKARIEVTGSGELKASNVELRAATEELETGRRELESTNEEIISINQKLSRKVDELSRINSDLQNLMATEARSKLAVHEPGHLRSSIRDHGFGFDMGTLRNCGRTGTGFGLLGLYERLEMLGGKLELKSKPNHGVEAVIIAPMLKLEQPDN